MILPKLKQSLRELLMKRLKLLQRLRQMPLPGRQRKKKIKLEGQPNLQLRLSKMPSIRLRRMPRLLQKLLKMLRQEKQLLLPKLREMLKPRENKFKMRWHAEKLKKMLQRQED